MAQLVCPQPRINAKQVEFLEYLIWRSRDASDVVRKLLIWLLRQTNRLTMCVFVNCPPEICKEVSYGLHDMCSCGGTTHLDAVFNAAGSAISPALYNGTYTDDGRLVNSGGFAVFIHNRKSRASSRRVECDMSAINAITEPNPYRI
jgi:hypothetical protein